MITAKQAHQIATGEIKVDKASLLTSLFEMIDCRCKRGKFNLTYETIEELKPKALSTLESLGFRVVTTDTVIKIFW